MMWLSGVNLDDFELVYINDDIVDMVFQSNDGDVSQEDNDTDDAADDDCVTTKEGFNALKESISTCTAYTEF